MTNVREARSADLSPPEPGAGVHPQLLEWLHSGRLRLVDSTQRAIPAEEWTSLPSEVRQQALDDFQRVVRSKAKAAVLFLRA